MKKLLLTIMTFCCVLFAGLLLANEAQAGELVDIDDSSVFVKQQTSKTCTLCSAEMMVRRASILTGNTDWEDIEEWGFREYAWVEGGGLNNAFWYNGIHVEHGWLSGGSSNYSTLISLLEDHPEGIVIYNTGKPHAVLLTDYTDGTFYIADPSNAAASGRVPISYATGGVSVTSVTQYWYVSNLDLADTIKVSFNFNGGWGGTTEMYFRHGYNVFYSNERGTKPITSITIPEKKRYDFKAYLGDGSCGGEYGETYVYTSGTFASDLCQDITSDATFYAKWEDATPVRLTLNAGNGTANQYVYFYKDFNEFYPDEACSYEIYSVETPTKLGYEFVHYYGDGLSGGDYGERYIFSDGTFAWDIAFDITRNATLYAKWNALTLESIEISQLPYKRSYLVGQDEIDLDGGTLTLNYAEGKTQETVITADMISGFDKAAEGDQIITVTYKGMTATYTVNVSPYETGDINCDGKVNINDAMMILMHSYFPNAQEYDFGLRYADFNRDGAADYTDAVQLMMHVCFPKVYEIK